MPKPITYRLVLTAISPHPTPTKSEFFEFEAFPAGSCTLAQHHAAKAWYALQDRLDAKEASQSENR